MQRAGKATDRAVHALCKNYFLLNEFVKNPYSKLEIDSDGKQKMWQEKVIHQLDLYHEEESSKSAFFSIGNSLIEINYKMNEE